MHLIIEAIQFMAFAVVSGLYLYQRWRTNVLARFISRMKEAKRSGR